MANRDGQKCIAAAWSTLGRGGQNPTTNICWLSLKLWLEHRLQKGVDQATLALKAADASGGQRGKGEWSQRWR